MSNPLTIGIILLIIIYILWLLLVKGLLWKLSLAISGWFGIWIFLDRQFEWAHNSGIIISGHLINWAVIIPTIIFIMAIFRTKEEDL